jgi:hypothetical protein
VAYVTAAVLADAPGCRLAVADLNLEAWERAAREEPGGTELVAFLRGRRGRFYDPEEYRGWQGVWSRVRLRVAGWGAEARAFVESGGPPPGFLEPLAERALSADPELLGLSVLFPEQLPFALALARRARELQPGLRVVLGGATLSALHVEDLLAACPFVDAVLPGEGEPGAGAVFRGAPWREVPGLVWWEAGAPCRAPAAAPPEPHRLPAPDFSLLPLDRYWNPVPVLPALGSRGCRWRRCRFCAHNDSFGAHRARAAESVAAELAALGERHGARHFYLADQYVPAAALDGLSAALPQRAPEAAFHVMGRPGAEYGPECLERAGRAGCRWISWGVESGSQRLLDLVRKGTRVEQVERVLADGRRAGISNLAMLVFGLPTSGEADLEQTLAFLERTWGDLEATTASSFVLFEGTAFARRPERYGVGVLGNQELLRADGRPVRSRRLIHREVASDGSLRPPRGLLEVAAWERRRAWLGAAPFFEGLCPEHYLLHADARRRPRWPHQPLPRAA